MQAPAAVLNSVARSFTRSLWTRFATLYRTRTAASRRGEIAV
jgi:hypothetical protein